MNNKIEKKKPIGKLKIKHKDLEEIEIEIYSSIEGENNEMLVNEYLHILENVFKDN